MVEKNYIINNRLGLHARPASLFVKTTGRFTSSVKIVKDGQEIDGKSIMGLLMLAAGPGTELKVVVDGPDENDVITAIDDLFSRHFDDDIEGE
ncbi:MAG: HPr family phosphocarrier protein [Elusimicrobia bacterium]|nr:HPr family phosphocarrier protein [Elusimicrobiota bacterium]